MSLDRYLYCRIKKDTKWVVPDADITKQFNLGRRGEFLWFSMDDLCMTLFANTNHWFKTNRNYTFAIEDAPYFEWSIGYEDLRLEEWPDIPLIMGAKVKAKNASLFSDGNQNFPKESLIATGVTEQEIEDINRGDDTNIQTTPIDRIVGRGRHELEGANPDYLLPVTWTTTVFELFGEQRYQRFLDLKRVTKFPGDLMVICEVS